MTMKNNAVAEIVKAIRALKADVFVELKATDHLNFHPDLHQIFGMILYNDALGVIDWTKVSSDVNSEQWALQENLDGKSMDELRAMVYMHLRKERFSRGHIQSLAASGYLNKWADALETCTSKSMVA